MSRKQMVLPLWKSISDADTDLVVIVKDGIKGVREPPQRERERESAQAMRYESNRKHYSKRQSAKDIKKNAYLLILEQVGCSLDKNSFNRVLPAEVRQQ